MYLNDFAVNQKDNFERAVSVKNIYNHPDYYSSEMIPRNDIALLETSEFIYGSEVQGNAAPACLPPRGFLQIVKADGFKIFNILKIQIQRRKKCKS